MSQKGREINNNNNKNASVRYLRCSTRQRRREQAPYPVHMNNLMSQMNEAERRRASMTPNLPVPPQRMGASVRRYNLRYMNEQSIQTISSQPQHNTNYGTWDSVQSPRVGGTPAFNNDDGTSRGTKHDRSADTQVQTNQSSSRTSGLNFEQNGSTHEQSSTLFPESSISFTGSTTSLTSNTISLAGSSASFASSSETAAIHEGTLTDDSELSTITLSEPDSSVIIDIRTNQITMTTESGALYTGSNELLNNSGSFFFGQPPQFEPVTPHPVVTIETGDTGMPFLHRHPANTNSDDVELRAIHAIQSFQVQIHRLLGDSDYIRSPARIENMFVRTMRFIFPVFILYPELLEESQNRAIEDINNTTGENVLNTVSPTTKVQHWDLQDKCVICLSDFEINQDIRCLCCTHKFHAVCIDTWCKSALTCPMCRRGIDGTIVSPEMARTAPAATLRSLEYIRSYLIRRRYSASGEGSPVPGTSHESY